MSFNIISEQFIPVVLSDGRKDELNLLDTLKKAHLIKEISLECSNHLRQFALYRFLSVLAADITRPVTVDDILDIYESGKFEASLLDKYFEDYRGRFDLYDDRHPFMQTPKELFKDMDKAKVKADGLEPVLRDGTNDIFYNPIHYLKSMYEWDEKSLAIQLIQFQMHHLRTGAGYKAPFGGGSGRTPVYILYKGNNLYQTLVFGMRPVNDADIPIWRRDGFGYRCEISDMNFSFYPTIKVHLDKDDHGYIYMESDNTNPLFKEVESVNDKLNTCNPHTICYRSKDGKNYVESAKMDIKPWMTLGTLYSSSHIINDGINRSSLVINELYKENLLPETLAVEYYGMDVRNTPYVMIYERYENIDSSMIIDEVKQQNIDRLLNFIKKSNDALVKNIENWLKDYMELYESFKASGAFADASRRFYKKSEHYFLTKVMCGDIGDIGKHISAIGDIAMDIYDSLPEVDRSILFRMKYRKKLDFDMKKEADKCIAQK